MQIIRLKNKRMMEKLKENFSDAVIISKRLRRECPWDKQQDFNSYCKYLVEEANEVKKAVEDEDYDGIKEELGDLFWNILFMSNIGEECGIFDLNAIIVHSKEKMIRRHPHIFGDASKDLESIHKKWEEIKLQERDKKKIANKFAYNKNNEGNGGNEGNEDK